MKWFSLVFILFSFCTWGQTDTINCGPPTERRSGYWTITGAKKNLPYYCDTCIIEEGNFNRGRKTGLWTKYYPNGEKKSQINYYNGRSIGPFVTYYENGNPEEIGEWLGKRYNGFIRLYESGELQYKKIDQRSLLWHYQNEDSLLVEFDILSCIDSNDVFNAIAFDSLINSYGFRNILSTSSNLITHTTTPAPIIHTISSVWGETMIIVNSNISDEPTHYNITEDKQLNCNCKRDKWKCYDQEDRIILKGKFKNSIFDQGHIYLYDEVGQLIIKEKYKNGEPQNL